MLALPRSAILGDMEGVAFHGTWWNWTFCDTICSVLVTLTKLSDAMPVDGSSGISSDELLKLAHWTHSPVVLQIVIHVHLDVVSPIFQNLSVSAILAETQPSLTSRDCWSRKLV